MEALYLLIPMALVLVLLVVGILWWATHSGQFDDLDSPAVGVLLDDDDHVSASANPNISSSASSTSSTKASTNTPAPPSPGAPRS